MIFEAINIFGVKVIGEVTAIRNFTVILKDFQGIKHVIRKENLPKSLLFPPSVNDNVMACGWFDKNKVEKMGYNPYEVSYY